MKIIRLPSLAAPAGDTPCQYISLTMSAPLDMECGDKSFQTCITKLSTELPLQISLLKTITKTVLARASLFAAPVRRPTLASVSLQWWSLSCYWSGSYCLTNQTKTLDGIIKTKLRRLVAGPTII